MQIHEKMGAWGCMPFAPTLFLYSLLPPLAEAGISAAYMPHERISPRSGPEGRTLRAAKQSVIEAGKKAVAAMTCHRICRSWPREAGGGTSCMVTTG